VIENAPVTFGAMPGSGERSPGGTSPRRSASLKVLSTTITTLVPAPLAPATSWMVPVSVALLSPALRMATPVDSTPACTVTSTGV
jgi:hypothetical protein